MRKLLISFLLLALTVVISAQVIFYKPLSERLTGYTMDVELDPEAKIVTGSMEAYWVNNSQSPVPDIQMHMYLNAFRSNKSTFYRESNGSPGSSEIDYGWVEINNIIDRSGKDLSGLLEYISPDDGNPDDMTVLRLNLPEPVAPGD
ncbi:MAG TPA: hypothetical protein VJ877_03650, partial [Bacteroidales bacterium]|nr:hypothetical protein [Bacteroidales bacterium]